MNKIQDLLGIKAGISHPSKLKFQEETSMPSKHNWESPESTAKSLQDIPSGKWWNSSSSKSPSKEKHANKLGPMVSPASVISNSLKPLLAIK